MGTHGSRGWFQDLRHAQNILQPVKYCAFARSLLRLGKHTASCSLSKQT